MTSLVTRFAKDEFGRDRDRIRPDCRRHLGRDHHRREHARLAAQVDVHQHLLAARHRRQVTARERQNAKPRLPAGAFALCGRVLGSALLGSRSTPRAMDRTQAAGIVDHEIAAQALEAVRLATAVDCGSKACQPADRAMLRARRRDFQDMAIHVHGTDDSRLKRPHRRGLAPRSLIEIKGEAAPATWGWAIAAARGSGADQIIVNMR